MVQPRKGGNGSGRETIYHGREGTGPQTPSNAKVFAQRGDPWVSLRQGVEDFGRNLDREDPDIDRYWYAKKAVEKFDMPSEKRGEITSTPMRRLANANLADINRKKPTRV